MTTPRRPRSALPRPRRVPALLAVSALAALAALGAAPPAAQAAPYAPARDDEVVEQLPARLGSPAERAAARAEREALRARPEQLPLALQLARRAVERARRLGDPRELGEAEAVLAPWWKQVDAPAPVQLLRAIVRQSRHEFDTALADLDRLLAPGTAAPIEVRAQAELTRASVHQVTGRWRDAQAGCERLAGRDYAALGDAVAIPARVCLADLASLRGDTAAAAQAIAVLADSPAAADDGAWLALVQAEMAERRGDPAAGRHYLRALQQGGDVYTLGAYADWLLDRDRPADVVKLLAGQEPVDPLLLRLAIAHHRLGDARAAATAATLQARFDAARARGDAIHGREEARFALEVTKDAAAAYRHAAANWAVQKEPADALILARAARAAGRAEAEAQLRRFVAETGWSDVRLGAALAGPAGAAAPAGARS